ncbi:hypothetical protein RF11_05238 [Thelohanellus kitauei]|uniref:Uncharacterized protein n=1 Tax=Thelohanellus kitauei TaxID=669202 RepID=A0A0C2MM23_THEKT|nr:hypothetical protein RF11_05238 [Thelohanellus kitauei]
MLTNALPRAIGRDVQQFLHLGTILLECFPGYWTHEINFCCASYLRHFHDVMSTTLNHINPSIVKRPHCLQTTSVEMTKNYEIINVLRLSKYLITMRIVVAIVILLTDHRCALILEVNR